MIHLLKFPSFIHLIQITHQIFFFIDSDSNDLDRICINNNQDINILFDVKPGRLAQGNYTVNFENEELLNMGQILKDLI